MLCSFGFARVLFIYEQIAMEHKHMICNIAAHMVAEGKSAQIAVAYDEIVRQLCISAWLSVLCRLLLVCVQAQLGKPMREPWS